MLLQCWFLFSFTTLLSAAKFFGTLYFSILLRVNYYQNSTFTFEMFQKFNALRGCCVYFFQNHFFNWNFTVIYIYQLWLFCDIYVFYSYLLKCILYFLSYLCISNVIYAFLAVFYTLALHRMHTFPLDCKDVETSLP